MGQRRFFAGMIGAIASVFGGRKSHQPNITHIPAHERWEQSKAPGRGRWHSSRRPYRWYQKRQARTKQARMMRRRSRGQRRSQN